MLEYRQQRKGGLKMGSRTAWKIVTNDSGAVTWLYSHWGGDSKLRDTRDALVAAMPRWSDTTYGARIFISNIVRENWGNETGFGLTATLADADCPFEEGYDLVTVDFTTNTLTYGKFELTFDEFLDEERGVETPTGRITFDNAYQNRANRVGA
jgi:hypothetical protein